jgi:hypothetical protein
MAASRSLKLTAIGIAIFVCLLLAARFILRERGRADIVEGQTRAALTVISSSFKNEPSPVTMFSFQYRT